jgi:NAD(P)-dependent dehydrogenase (short-subunit alcohol dehydrogenase family)
MDRAAWDQVLHTNATGTYLMCKFALPHLVEAGGGSVVNISSVAGTHGIRQRAAYNAAKGAVCTLTKNLAADFGPKSVRANAILPGLVETDMPKFFQAQSTGRDWQQVVDQSLSAYPLGRIGQPQDVAHCVLFLASDESSWITGQMIAVDGGLTSVLL